MLTLDDCIALSELTDEEIAAIAEHEHLPMIVAAELGSYLIHSADGVPRIKRIIAADIAAAGLRGDYRHALALKLVLRHFTQHAECRESDRSDRDKVVQEFLTRLPVRATPQSPGPGKA